LIRPKNADGSIAAETERRAPSVFSKIMPEHHVPALPPRADAFKSSGRARARKSAAAASGRKQSNKLWLTGPVDSLATIFHAWRWGRKQPGRSDLRSPIYTSPQQRLMIFLLDVSDSMSGNLDLMRRWMAISMGEAYFRRDPLAIITVQGAGAKLLVHPTTSIHFVLYRLGAVVVGGGTPLDQGLALISRMLRQWHNRYPVIDLVVLSDGRSTNSLAAPEVIRATSVIKKFIHRAAVVNPVPIADRFARKFAALIGAEHITTES
jgi:Mg-chelatase subunit ChlD